MKEEMTNMTDVELLSITFDNRIKTNSVVGSILTSLHKQFETSFSVGVCRYCIKLRPYEKI